MSSDGPEGELSSSTLTRDRGFPGVVVSLAGRAGIGDCGWIRGLLELQAAPGQGRVVVDLSRLSSMDWWVVLMLAWAGRVISRRGGMLVLVSPQPDVARLLNAASISGVVTICDSIPQASGSPGAVRTDWRDDENRRVSPSSARIAHATCGPMP